MKTESHIEYINVHAGTLKELDEKVNICLQRGFNVYGELKLVNCLYIQTVIKTIKF